MEISAAWGWRGLEPEKVVETNSFGNVIVKDKVGKYWRICPEELDASIIADSTESFEKIWTSKEFIRDWNMGKLVQVARGKLGALAEGRCYCLKIPGIFGGKYEMDNLGIISISEIIRFSGDIAKKIKDLPDGSKIEFKFVS